MKCYYLPAVVLMACAVNAYAQKSNGQSIMLGVDKSKKPDHEHGPNFANRSLSNLFQTSIDADLLPDESNKRNLGSLNRSWKNLYLTGSIYLDGKVFISNKGERNIFIGSLPRNVNVFARDNIAIGNEALLNNTLGRGNVAIGSSALTSNTTGDQNNAVGTLALTRNTTGIFNNAFGFLALTNNVTGSANTAVGNAALNSNTTGDLNSAFGQGTLSQNTSGHSNTAIGGNSLISNTEGVYNTSTGRDAMTFNIAGGGNSAFGATALYYNTSGSSNTAIGFGALGHVLNGLSNTAIGARAGFGPFERVIDFSYGTCVGAESNVLGNLTNFTAIGYGAVAFQNNQVVVGNTAVTSIGGYANWSNFSDGRYKNNIKEDVPGLEFITQLRPITYTLNVDEIERVVKPASTGSKNHIELPAPNNLKLPFGNSSPIELNNKPTEIQLIAKDQKAKIVYTGFVAQEVEKLAEELNYDFSGVDAPENENGFYSLRYGDFVVPLVKAVQELNKKNEELEQRIQKLEALLSNEELSLNKKPDTKYNETVYLSSARLEQNSPNPSKTSTIIRYYLPNEFSSASVVISDMKGKIIKNISLKAKGAGQINLNTVQLTSGTYSYSLLADGKQIDSRLMIVGK